METEGDACSHFHESSYLDGDGQVRTRKVPVVQELVRRGVARVPASFHLKLPNSIDRGRLAVAPPDPTLPTVSVAKLRDGPGELAELRRGVEEWGMVLVRDHGIEAARLERVRDAVKSFFDLPFDRKRESIGTLTSADNMGYGRNFVKSDGQRLDWIDRVTMKAAPPEAVDRRAWPKSPPNFREVMESYVAEARTLMNELLQSLAKALGLETNAFIRYYDPKKSEINVRVNYYPPCPAPESVLGITPHSDASGLTLLLESEATGGLQVMNKAWEWVTVPWPRDALLVIVGDLLEIMSNGRILSPWHRAVPLRDTERFSVALFYNPPADTEVEPVKQLGKEDKYTKVIVKDYLRNYYEINPTEDKQAITYAKA